MTIARPKRVLELDGLVSHAKYAARRPIFFEVPLRNGNDGCAFEVRDEHWRQLWTLKVDRVAHDPGDRRLPRSARHANLDAVGSLSFRDLLPQLSLRCF